MATTSFDLGEKLDDYISSKIASGEFKTKADVVRSALRQQQRRDDERAALIDYLRAGIDSGAAGSFSAGDVANRVPDRSKRSA